MLFADYTRVIYEKNPLESVICQLRFPQILRIDAQPPADFQDRLRSEYPTLNVRNAGQASVSFPPEIQKLLSPQIQEHLAGDKRIYNLCSIDETWQISLAGDFIALQTTKYRKWDEFITRLVAALEVLESIYRPAFYTRIGLRYRDLIRRSLLDLKDVPWAELLQPHIAAELTSPDVARSTKGTKRDIAINLDDEQGQVRIRHGLISPEGGEEVCYLIDADFSTDQKTEAEYARQRLDYFNRHAGRFFKWCITDRLHNAMEPRPL